LSESFEEDGSTHLTINYRLSTPRFDGTTTELPDRFPRPIHDVCTSFDYILRDIVPALSPSSPANPINAPSIFLTGSHIGAALATTLALTSPTAISALAIHNPLADWVSLDEHLTLSPPSSANKHSKKPLLSPSPSSSAIALAARQLIDARTQLFRSPSAYFDPFASPILFLRAPGRDTPWTHAEALGLLDPATKEDEGPAWNYFDGPPPPPAVGEEEDAARQLPATRPPAWPGIPTLYRGSSDSLLLPESGALAVADLAKSQTPRRRKVLRRWPAVGQPEDVMLPRVHVFASAYTPPSSGSGRSGGEDDAAAGLSYILGKQAEELANLLRRACFWGRESGFAEERVGFTVLEGNETSASGRQGQGQGGGLAALAMAQWLQERAATVREERRRMAHLLS
jgi:hypothetical protein